MTETNDVRNCPVRLLANGCGECDGCREQDEHATAAQVMPDRGEEYDEQLEGRRRP